MIRGVGTSIGKIVELEVYTGNSYAQSINVVLTDKWQFVQLPPTLYDGTVAALNFYVKTYNLVAGESYEVAAAYIKEVD